MLKNLLNRILAPTPAPLPSTGDTPAADALIDEGNACEDAGRPREAEALYRSAVAKAPRHARAHLNLGIVLEARGDADGAVAAFEQVLAIDPRHPFGNYNLARVMVLRADTGRALALVEEALRAKPEFPQAQELLVRILRDEGFAAEALAVLRGIIEHDPGNWLHRSFELIIMNFADDVPADDMFRRHVEFGALLEQAVPVRFHGHRDRGDPQRRLRVGYLSGDFIGHPVAFFLAPVLEHHDRSQVEVFCYSLAPKPDAKTVQIRAASDHWRDVATLSDDEIADAIHADGIDVLVDLMGHSSIPRLGVFCQRPAPTQVGWLGYLNTTGLTRMDFRLTDARSDPPAISQAVHTERLVALPASQWCYPGDATHEIDPVPPFERNGTITFGSFNAALKVTPAACRRWAEVMLRVPGSRLVIGDINAERKRAAIRRDMASAGVGEDRIAFLPRVGAGEYMGLYNTVDITFDTFPYGGGTTTFDSLWMGVPVVAAVGETPVSRSAAGILAALALDDWIAPSPDDFVALAVARASDREALRALRRDLRPRLQASPLTDLPRFVRDLESACREMWLATAPAGDVAGADALIAEGNALEAKGDAAGAERAYEACLAIAPDHPFGNYNFARLALLRGELARAEALVAAAVRAKPDFPQALVLQSNVLDALGRHEPAIAAVRAALRLQPDDPGGWFNLGSMLRLRARPEEAEDALRRALAGDPDNVAALGMLAAALGDQGFADEALAALEAAAALHAPAWPARSLELLLALYVDRLSEQEIFRRHCRFGADLEQAHPARFQHVQKPRDPARRLRIGYFSGDFLLHPVSFFLLPVIERHDRRQVEVFCYSFTRGADKMTARLRELSDHWRDVDAMTDEAIADAIHADGIDVLVDLAGHTGRPPRLAVFAQRPAPVQVSWLGYLCTTGLTRIDHRLTDRFADPLEIARPQHTERLQYLPASQWCYESLVHEPISPGAPFERQGHLTFGSFNAALKITEATCRRWGELLARVPRSRLLVANIKSPRKRDAILRAIAAAGVDVARVTFTARVPLDQYLALHNSVDIALDSFPYGGGTTTLDAIYMGAPVAAAVGERSVSRSAASVLRALGLDDWIAPSIDGWVDMVVARAGDRAALKALRAELRPRLLASPLADMPRFVRDLEAAYRAMWEAAGT